MTHLYTHPGLTSPFLSGEGTLLLSPASVFSRLWPLTPPSSSGIPSNCFSSIIFPSISFYFSFSTNFFLYTSATHFKNYPLLKKQNKKLSLSFLANFLKNVHFYWCHFLTFIYSHSFCHLAFVPMLAVETALENTPNFLFVTTSLLYPTFCCGYAFRGGLLQRAHIKPPRKYEIWVLNVLLSSL